MTGNKARMSAITTLTQTNVGSSSQRNKTIKENKIYTYQKGRNKTVPNFRRHTYLCIKSQGIYPSEILKLVSSSKSEDTR